MGGLPLSKDSSINIDAILKSVINSSMFAGEGKSIMPSMACEIDACEALNKKVYLP